MYSLLGYRQLLESGRTYSMQGICEQDDGDHHGVVRSWEESYLGEQMVSPTDLAAVPRNETNVAKFFKALCLRPQSSLISSVCCSDKDEPYIPVLTWICTTARLTTISTHKRNGSGSPPPKAMARLGAENVPVVMQTSNNC